MKNAEMLLKKTCDELNYKWSLHQALSGSIYYIINGIKFRISDHIQPSHYQLRNYFDVNSISEIIDIISNELFSFSANPQKCGNEYVNAIYNTELDCFDIKKITKFEYNELVMKLEEKNKFFSNYGFVGNFN